MKKSINEYNLIKYLKFLLKEENKKKKKGIDTTKIKENQRIILKGFAHNQRNISEEIKKLKNENDIFQKSYKMYSKKNKFYYDVIFEDLFIKYKQRGYKIPNLSTKHNLFSASPLLLQNKKINDFYEYDKYKEKSKKKKKNNKPGEGEKSLKYLEKIDHYLFEHNLLSKNKNNNLSDFNKLMKSIEQEKRNSVIIKLNKINNLHYKSKTIDFDNKSVSKKEKINYSEEIPKIEDEIKNIKKTIKRLNSINFNNQIRIFSHSINNKNTQMLNKTKYKTIKNNESFNRPKNLKKMIKKRSQIKSHSLKNNDIELNENKLSNESLLINSLENKYDNDYNNKFGNTISTFHTINNSNKNYKKSRNFRNDIQNNDFYKTSLNTNYKTINSNNYFNTIDNKTEYLEKFMRLPIGDLNNNKKIALEYHKKFKNFNEDYLNKIIKKNVSQNKLLEKMESLNKKIKKSENIFNINTKDKKIRYNLNRIKNYNNNIYKMNKLLIKNLIKVDLNNS